MVFGVCSRGVGFGRLVAVKPGDGRVVGHPPVTFPFYGLVGWDGPRWVEFFEGAAGHPVATLWLGHRRRDSRAHLSVGSSTDRGRPGMSNIDSELAFAVAFVLTERMRPDRSTAPLPAGFNRVQVDHALQVADHYREWPVVGCVVDGTEWPLRYWRFAGGWAGYVSGMGEVSIKLVGAGTTPRGLALETVRDPVVYDFDPTARLSLSQLAQAHHRRPEATLPLPWSTSIHPDQAALRNQAGLL